MPKLSEVQGICFVLFTSCIFALCSKTNKTISHCELKKGAHKSAVNRQRKEVCWLCWVSSCLLCVWQLRIPDLSPDQKSNGQITLPPCQYLCALHSSQLHLEGIPKWFQQRSLQWLNGKSCGKVRECFCYEPFAPTRAVLLGRQVAQRSSLF